MENHHAGYLPLVCEGMRVDKENIVVSAYKRAEDGDGIVVRMYEAYKERKTVTLSIPNAKSVVLCDLNENEIETMHLENNQVVFQIKPFEIITIKIKG